MRSQAAVDFLVSWGWVIIIIVLVLSLLFAFGIFSVPPQPTLINGFQGVGVTVASANSSLAVFKISNGAGTPVNLDNIVVTVSGNSYSALDCFSTSVANGQTVLCRVPVTIKTSSYLMDVSLIYSPVGSQLYLYSNGTISGGVSRGILPLNNVVSYFDEENLPSGSVWSVTYDSVQKSQTVSGSSSFISFSTPFGTYSYSVSLTSTPSCTGISASPSSGQLATGGTATIFFGGGSCTTTFDETGLNTGTSWSVAYDSLVQSSTGTSIIFNVPAGKYSFSLSPFSAAGCSYSPNPSSGELQAGTTQSISYSSSCTTTFTESGLPSSTSWSVTYNSQTLSSTGTSISFTDSAGSYSYSVSSPTVSGCTYSPSPSSGSLTAGQSQAISYSGNCTTTFTESGLPSSTSWSVTYNSVSKSSTGLITFYDTPGSYSFSVSSPVVSSCTYSPSPSSGSLTAGQSQAISYSGNCTTTFTESGLPSSTSWSVIYNSNTKSSTGTSISFYDISGSYSFTASSPQVSGCAYSPTPSSGTLTAGSSQSISYSGTCPVFSQILDIQNSQTTATPVPFQQMVNLTISSTNSKYINQSGHFAFQNLEFVNASNGAVIDSWLENYTSKYAIYWLKLPDGIPAASTTIIVLYYFKNTTNLFNSIDDGEAPQLSQTYGQYDDGANVFQAYDNFVGSTLNSSSMNWAGGTNVAVSNGLTFKPCTSSDCSAGINTIEDFYVGNQSMDFYGTYATENGNAYSAARFGLNTNNAAGLGGQSSSTATYMSNTTTIENLQTDYYSSAAVKSVWTIQTYENKYAESFRNYGDAFTEPTAQTSSTISFFLQQNSGGEYYTNWIRIRNSPPNGVMPSVSVFSQLLDIQNSQTTATPVPFQQMVNLTINSTNSKYINQSGHFAFQNLEFVNASNGAVIDSWLEKNTSKYAIYWLKLPEGIPASTTIKDIVLCYFKNTTNLFNSITDGEAPQLSQTYGQYDDGANVFNFYDNFSGTTINTAVWQEINSGAGSYSQNNGITISETAYKSSTELVSVNEYSGLLEGLVTSQNTGSFRGTGMEIATTLPSSGALQNGYRFMVSTNSEPGSYIQVVNSGSGTTLSSNSAVPGVPYLLGALWPETGSEIFGDNYASHVSATNSSFSVSPYYISLYAGSDGSNYGTITFQYVRIRAIPPNGVMPSVAV